MPTNTKKVRAVSTLSWTQWQHETAAPASSLTPNCWFRKASLSVLKVFLIICSYIKRHTARRKIPAEKMWRSHRVRPSFDMVAASLATHSELQCVTNTGQICLRETTQRPRRRQRPQEEKDATGMTNGCWSQRWTRTWWTIDFFFRCPTKQNKTKQKKKKKQPVRPVCSRSVFPPLDYLHLTSQRHRAGCWVFFPYR